MKQRMPVIIGVSVLVIAAIVVGVLFAMHVIGPQPQTADDTSSAPAASPTPGGPPPGAPGMPPGGPAMRPGMPGGPGMRPGMKPMNSAQAAKAAQLAKKAALAKAKANAKKQQLAKKPAVPPAVPGAPGALGTPGAATAATAGAPNAKQVANAMPDPATVPDPFKLPPVKNPITVDQTEEDRLPGIPTIPDPILTNWHPPVKSDIDTENQAPPPVQSSAGRRMAGVLFGDGVYAILETNGKAEAVQPGDTVEGGKVVSISADGLTIKTDDDRTIFVPLSSTPTGGEQTGGGSVGFPGGGFPGAPPSMAPVPPDAGGSRRDNE